MWLNYHFKLRTPANLGGGVLEYPKPPWLPPCSCQLDWLHYGINLLKVHSLHYSDLVLVYLEHKSKVVNEFSHVEEIIQANSK